MQYTTNIHASDTYDPPSYNNDDFIMFIVLLDHQSSLLSSSRVNIYMDLLSFVIIMLKGVRMIPQILFTAYVAVAKAMEANATSLSLVATATAAVLAAAVAVSKASAALDASASVAPALADAVKYARAAASAACCATTAAFFLLVRFRRYRPLPLL